MSDIPEQQPDQTVDITEWETADQLAIFEGGSKPKRSVICPDGTRFEFLIPGHTYLFKNAVDWLGPQMWSEVVAYRLSHLCDVRVPPAFVAVDSGKPGVLIEFFYGYPDEKPTKRLIHGTDLMQRWYGPRYDSAKGRPHSLSRIVGLCKAFRVPHAEEWWAKTVMFDALIGNTDRHAQNWGLLFQPTAVELAPAYDNGTSLGYSFNDAELERPISDVQLRSFIDRGRHHISAADSYDKRGDRFTDLCHQFCTDWPHLRIVIGRLLPTPDAPIAKILQPLTRFDSPVPFSAQRADLVERLLRARRDDIANRLGL